MSYLINGAIWNYFSHFGPFTGSKESEATASLYTRNSKGLFVSCDAQLDVPRPRQLPPLWNEQEMATRHYIVAPRHELRTSLTRKQREAHMRTLDRQLRRVDWTPLIGKRFDLITGYTDSELENLGYWQNDERLSNVVLPDPTNYTLPLKASIGIAPQVPLLPGSFSHEIIGIFNHLISEGTPSRGRGKKVDEVGIWILVFEEKILATTKTFVGDLNGIDSSLAWKALVSFAPWIEQEIRNPENPISFDTLDGNYETWFIHTHPKMLSPLSLLDVTMTSFQVGNFLSQAPGLGYSVPSPSKVRVLAIPTIGPVVFMHTTEL